MSTKVRFNTQLISSLGSVLRMSAAEMMDAVSIPSTTWYRLMKAPSDITIQQLLAIANGLHIPVRHFFSEGDVSIIGQREEYVTEPYTPCSYDADALQNLISDSPDNTWKHAAEITGMVPYRLKDSLTGSTRTPVRRFLLVCETFHIDPFAVLIDPNPATGKQRKTAARRSDITILEEITRLRNTIDKLASKIDELSSKYDELSVKYDKLLLSQQLLSQRLDNSKTIGLAAEPEPEPTPD